MADAAKDHGLRDHVARLLEWGDAHVDFDHATADMPAVLRGRVPPAATHSAWQIIEHIRLAQHDILDFCVNPSYRELTFPDDYWPRQPEPPDEESWEQSVAACRADRQRLVALVRGESTDLFAPIAHGNGQTILREALLVADHSAYHVGQLVLLRRLLGCWPAA